MSASTRGKFGRRVRAARAYAGISQSELADGIAARFPDASASTATVKRLENDDPGVKGSVYEWAPRIAPVTGVPGWFLVGNWEGAAAVLLPALSVVNVELERLRVAAAKARERATEAEGEYEELEAARGDMMRRRQETRGDLERRLRDFRPGPNSGRLLQKYGRHLNGCASGEGWKAEDWPDGPPCTCGFDNALKDA